MARSGNLSIFPIPDSPMVKLAKERMKICKSCENYNEKIGTCRKCGCFLAAKTMGKDWHCPIKKW